MKCEEEDEEDEEEYEEDEKSMNVCREYVGKNSYLYAKLQRVKWEITLQMRKHAFIHWVT